ncbi:hypothetical protein [Nocardia aurantiaca]|uniref:hypothetical protein n=1 Tax=Nocardia aurantiaca TaxID=2675850 RepID=UPI001E3AF680|nr:hypothetical protein [Nocardia aurantiaca]
MLTRNTLPDAPTRATPTPPPEIDAHRFFHPACELDDAAAIVLPEPSDPMDRWLSGPSRR